MKIKNPTLFPTTALPLSGPKGESLLTVIIKGTFAFGPGYTDVADAQQPIAYGDIYKDEKGGVYYESDIVPLKTCTDIVLNATAHAPNETPAEAVPVAVKVGATEKRLVVFGERYWNHAGVLSRKYTMTAAKPFVQKAIGYEDAFGGIDEISGAFCAENLSGKGLYGAKPKSNRAGKPLPCIEDPRHLIRSIADRPSPVGFGFYGRAWQPRAAYAGTYDQAWRENRCPSPPEDFDPRFYNGAHPDLQTNGYLKGDEPVQLHNLTTEGDIRFELPGLLWQSLVVHRKHNGMAEETRLSMNLDTLFFEPDKRRFCMVWRAAMPLAGDPEAMVGSVSVSLQQQ